MKSELLPDGRVAIKPPEGYEVDVEAGEFFMDSHSRGATVRFKPTAPQYVAVLLPRDAASNLSLYGFGGGMPVADIKVVLAANDDALNRAAVLIAGPGGCAEVSVEDVEDASVQMAVASAATVRNLNAALRKAAGGS